MYPFQARSQVILRGGAIQKEDGPNEAGRRGKSLGSGGELWLSETELRGKLTIGGGGGVDFKRVNVSHQHPPRRIRGHAPPENI